MVRAVPGCSGLITPRADPVHTSAPICFPLGCRDGFLLPAVSHTVQQLLQRSVLAPFLSSVLCPRDILATTPLRC